MKKTVISTAIAAVMTLAVSGSAFASPSPNGPGQPGAPNTTCSQYTATPGKSADANSPFNPNGNSGLHYAGNPDTSSLEHSNSQHAVSQYDIACYQQTVNH
jgi:hypothetical protein